ncbi:MAG: hypothetical protein AB1724_07255 [Thermodesulfobacteriota bacterium]
MKSKNNDATLKEMIGLIEDFDNKLSAIKVKPEDEKGKEALLNQAKEAIENFKKELSI